MATARLKISARDFWAMTPMELNAFCDAHIKAQPGYIEPVTREELEELMRMFPDEVPRGR